jgi:hypothetical protein
MKIFVMVFIILTCIQNVFAMCQAGYSNPIYICNYKKVPKVLELQKYKGGWSEIVFDDLTQITKEKGVKKETKFKATEKFNFFKKNELPAMNYKIVPVCNDTPTGKSPDKFVHISSADRSFCEKYDDNTMISQRKNFVFINVYANLSKNIYNMKTGFVESLGSRFSTEDKLTLKIFDKNDKILLEKKLNYISEKNMNSPIRVCRNNTDSNKVDNCFPYEFSFSYSFEYIDNAYKASLYNDKVKLVEEVIKFD